MSRLWSARKFPGNCLRVLGMSREKLGMSGEKLGMSEKSCKKSQQPTGASPLGEFSHGRQELILKITCIIYSIKENISIS